MKVWKRMAELCLIFVLSMSMMSDISLADTGNLGNKKNMTVMIYMVGSDLESVSGSASNDLMEIAESGADTRYNNIVIYTGGASAWQIDGLSAKEDSILQLSAGNLYVVDTVKATNMGDADTLSSFINYCYDNYNSESYSLILWNHGGGAVLGFGYDENYEDSLFLDEIKTALEESVGKRNEKLEMVGFDACLMSSLEVADVLEPYADYMVASQETEPGWGWDYSFLGCLTKQKIDGEQLGRNIVDSYVEFGKMAYELYPSLYCDMTLSCIDLSKYDIVEQELNTFFSSLGNDLTVNNVPKLSRSCRKVRGFGEFSSNYSYGMLDSSNLILSLSKSQSVDNADELIKAIEDMVVYSAGNVEDATGVSICYPNNTEDDYRQFYIYVSDKIGFADKYVNFITDIYDMEKGKTDTKKLDFSDNTSNVEKMEDVDKNSKYDISIQLSAEQQENISRVDAHILFNTSQLGWETKEDSERKDEQYMVVYTGRNFPIDENGNVHVYYADNALYARNALTEEITEAPLFLWEEDAGTKEKRYTCVAILNKFEYAGLREWNIDTVDIQIIMNDIFPNGQICSVIPVSDSEIPDKQLLCIDNFDLITIPSGVYYLTRNDNGEILPIRQWEKIQGFLLGYECPCSYFQLVSQPIQNPECFYCMFVFYDMQGNATSTELIPLVSGN